MKLGFIGLGRMGQNMVLRQLEQGNQIVVWNRSPEPTQELKVQSSKLKTTRLQLPSQSDGGQATQNLKIAENLEDLVGSLEAPRIIWLMVSAGSATQTIVDELSKFLTKGDIVIDGGNSFYKDSIRRGEALAKKGIHFMDVGTSGGVESARNGACLMVGGSQEDFKKAEEVFKAAAAPNAYGLLGKVGAGHFAKMIHNGIEYGMMEAIAEGAAILKNSEFNYDLREVFRVYSNKSIIESRLVSWTLAELKNDPELANISSVIGSGGGAGKTKGEAHWTVEIARELGLDVPVIEASLKVRENSDKDEESSPKGFRNKIVAAMRWQFGRHPVRLAPFGKAQGRQGKPVRKK